jgi:hypothetical protein
MPRQKETIAITTPHVVGDEDIGEIRNIVGFHIRLAHGAVYRHFTETFAQLDLTQKQVSALWLVADHPDIAQTGLAQRTHGSRHDDGDREPARSQGLPDAQQVLQ